MEEILGHVRLQHKTESVYRRYAIVVEADLRDGVERLARLHDGERDESGSADLKAGLVSLVAIALFAFLGYKAVQAYGWAFVVGMSLYAAGGVIFLPAQDWAGVGFHAFALVMIMRGYQAARAL